MRSIEQIEREGRERTKPKKSPPPPKSAPPPTVRQEVGLAPPGREKRRKVDHLKLAVRAALRASKAMASAYLDAAAYDDGRGWYLSPLAAKGVLTELGYCRRKLDEVEERIASMLAPPPPGKP